MDERVTKVARWWLWALPVWALLLFLGTLSHQPDAQTQFPAFAQYVTTSRFLFSHIFASILGGAIGSVGVVALLMYVARTKAMGRAFTGMVLMVAGNALVTAIFGIAAFAQPAMGRAFFANGQAIALGFYNNVYGAPLFGTVVAGLLLFMVGGAFVGIAIAASGILPRWAGWVFAISVPVFALSNFLLPIGQSFASVALIVATIDVAWSAARGSEHGQAPAPGRTPATPH